jgi:leucyl-tRNA---protein transferase
MESPSWIEMALGATRVGRARRPCGILLLMPRSENHPAGFSSLPLYSGQGHVCPYLPDRRAAERFAVCEYLDPTMYELLMNWGFRRSGRVVYRPTCEGCTECVPIRVPVGRFAPSRSQRRVWRRNADVSVEIGPPTCTEEKWRLYVSYLRHQHDGTMSEEYEGFEDFLYTSPAETLEMVYRVAGRIVAIGIADLCPRALSSVYCFFDPAESWRSLGVFSALREIEECRRRGLPYWYIGFYIRDCRRMSYKSSYRPNELLTRDGRWLPTPPPTADRTGASPR